MDSNTHSALPAEGLATLHAAVADLQARDLNGLADAAQAQRVLELRGLLDRLEGQWLRALAAVDARGAAGAEQGVQAGSTPAGSAASCAWAPAPPAAVSAPPGPCFAAP
jgi:hypothetical protein